MAILIPWRWRLGYTLWSRFLRYDPTGRLAKPRTVSCFRGHDSMLLYTLLHLAGVVRSIRGPGDGEPGQLDDTNISAVAFEDAGQSDMGHHRVKPQRTLGQGREFGGHGDRRALARGLFKIAARQATLTDMSTRCAGA